MRPTFYDSQEYREKKKATTKANQEKGIYSHLVKRKERKCALQTCSKSFLAAPAESKRFCNRSCSATNTNFHREYKIETRLKISKALSGRPSSGARKKGMIIVPREKRECLNAWCTNSFIIERWKKKRFCSASCAAKRPTSPKAARGKSGIRPDVSDSIYFHSRWEANMARIYLHERIEWLYEPKTFDIGGHMYTPDFYLPKYEDYIEVKNFMSPYSLTRDQKFRISHPNIRLNVILKDEYLTLEKMYAPDIPQWEFSRS